jgi:aryl-alcohol dehydrogenase
MNIKAAVFERPGEVPGFSALELAGPAPHEVLVKIRATGICHTDLKMASASTAPRPVVLGHEGAGVIEEVGSAVTSVAPGDHVVLTFASCGSCPSCHEAEPAYCHEMVPRNFGCSPALGRDYLFRNGKPVAGAFFGQSSFATHAIATERNVVKVRDDAPLELLGPFGCGIQTGAGAVLNDLQVKPGQSIAI